MKQLLYCICSIVLYANAIRVAELEFDAVDKNLQDKIRVKLQERIDSVDLYQKVENQKGMFVEMLKRYCKMNILYSQTVETCPNTYKTPYVAYSNKPCNKVAIKPFNTSRTGKIFWSMLFKEELSPIVMIQTTSKESMKCIRENLYIFDKSPISYTARPPRYSHNFQEETISVYFRNMAILIKK